MKKVSVILFMLFLGSILPGFSQDASKDFYAGKWEISVAGTPNGDVTLLADLVRKDGKLTGELTAKADPAMKLPVTKVEENGDKLSIYFDSSQAGEIAIDLSKVDNDNLAGTLMNNFETKAKRIKETAAKDYFAAKWEILVVGTPNGDAKFLTNLTRKDGKLTGELTDPSGANPVIAIDKIVEEGSKITIYFRAQEYDVNLALAKVDDNNLKGSLMDMFDASAKRVE